MAQFYTDDDVTRWEKASQASFAILSEKVADPTLPAKRIDLHLGMLSSAYGSRGMIDIAKRRFPEAVASFRAGIELQCRLMERAKKGAGESIEAGCYQSLLISYVVHDEKLTSEFARLFQFDSGTPGSIFLGNALRSIALNDFESARQFLAAKKPRFERQFVGYAECFEAIVEKDCQRFESTIRLATDSWSRWAAKAEKGLPGAVCFLQGVGLIRLAKNVIGQPIQFSSEHIPTQLLQS